jgi:hypothetical protein
MQLSLLAYAAISVPVLVGAFVAGVVFERQRVQTSSPKQLSVIPSTPGAVAAPSKAVTDPVPYQAPPSKGDEDPAPEARQVLREEKVAEAMQAIERAWRAAIEAEHLLAVKIGTCYGTRFIRRNAEVRADLAKIDGVSIVGVVRITGTTAANQSDARYSCYTSISEALAANRRSSESLEQVNATMTYKIDSTELRMDYIESNPGWLGVAINDNVRLKLGSWKAVSTQPIGRN